MPTLADIYSAADSFKRRLTDVVSNPLTSAQQMLGYANDRARAWNERMAQATNESMQTGEFITPQDKVMAAQLAEAYNPAGITVWHGSPHIFERFDLGKIGTGEGAQAYSKGLYTSGEMEVGKQYTPRDLNYENKLMSKYNQAQKSGDYASMQVYEDLLAQKTPEEVAANLGEMGYAGKDLQAAIQALEHGKKLYQNQTQGALYKVDLPDTHVRRMLDWDAPLKNQPYPVRNLAKKLGMDMNDLGGDLIGKVGKTDEGRKILQEAGIPGVKYIDESTRRAGREGIKNYVVFDPNHLTILERNAKPIK
jgi:hypothetical protein